MAVPTENLDARERSRARITILLFTVLMAVLFVELFSTPYVVTVYSKGCWSVNTDGIFSHFNVQGCGTKSWLIVDLYARVGTQPIANGANDVSVFLTQGAGSGGGCFGGSACGFNKLWTYAPPSPVECNGCVVTQLGLNPLSDLGSINFVSLPFVTWLLLIYLAGKIWDARGVYSGYLTSERGSLDWKDLPDRRKTLTTFAIGFLAVTTYQYVATWVYLFFQPVPTLNLPLAGLLIIPVAIWLARLPRWKFPLKGISYSSIPSSFGKSVNETASPESTSSLGRLPGHRSWKPVVLGIALIVALVTGTIIGPPLYSYTAAALAPKSNLQVIASPSSFTALPGSKANTTIMVKSLRGSAEHVTLRVDQTPSCNGMCTVPLLSVSLSQNSFSLSPDQNVVSRFDVNPATWADPGSYNFTVTASPDQGVPASALVTVHLAGFNMTTNPTVLDFTSTGSAQSTITITSVYGYAGLVTFYAYPDPCRWPLCQNGPVVSLSAKNVTLRGGGIATVDLTVTSMAQGSYHIVMTAESGPIFRVVQIPTTTSPNGPGGDFSLTANPANANVMPGQKHAVNVTVQVSSLNGCICIVHLALQGNTSYSYGPLDLYVDPTQSANATLDVSTGLYPSVETITVTASSGNLVHTVEIILRVT